MPEPTGRATITPRGVSVIQTAQAHALACKGSEDTRLMGLDDEGRVVCFRCGWHEPPAEAAER